MTKDVVQMGRRPWTSLANVPPAAQPAADIAHKLELLEELPYDEVGLCRHADFLDLCRGGHVETTGEVHERRLARA